MNPARNEATHRLVPSSLKSRRGTQVSSINRIAAAKRWLVWSPPSSIGVKPWNTYYALYFWRTNMHEARCASINHGYSRIPRKRGTLGHHGGRREKKKKKKKPRSKVSVSRHPEERDEYFSDFSPRVTRNPMIRWFSNNFPGIYGDFGTWFNNLSSFAKSLKLNFAI